MDTSHKLARIIDIANATDNVRRMMAGWNRTVALFLGDQVYHICIADGQAAILGEGNGQPALSFTLNEETLDALMAQHLTPLAAKLQGKIGSGGNIIDILRFASILSTAIKHLPSPTVEE